MSAREINTKQVKSISREDLVNKAYRLGFEYEKQKHNCSQCTVATLQQILEVNDEGMFQGAYPLAGGLGSTTQGTCGALSGGSMILGYLWGRSRQEFAHNTPSLEARYLAKRLYDNFTQEFGSCRCKDVQVRLFGRSFNFWDNEDREAFERAGGHLDKCPVVVGKTCAWTAGIIWDKINAA